MSSRIQLRRGTAATWTSVNPVLAAGEPGYETDTGLEKRGDGATAWSALGYLPPSSGGLLTPQQNGFYWNGSAWVPSRMETVARTSSAVQAARRRLLRENYPVAVATPPTVALGQGNQAGGGTMTTPTFYKPSTGLMSFRGAAMSDVSSSFPAATAGSQFYGPGVLTAAGSGDVLAYNVEWISDATIIEFYWAGAAGANFRVWIDGKLMQLASPPTGTALTPATSSLYSLSNTIITPTGANYASDGKLHFCRMTFSGSALRRFTIDGSFFYFAGVQIPLDNMIAPTRGVTAEKVVFLGDSYVAGTGADNRATGWARICADQLGWTCIQSGAGGTGYVNAGTSPNVPFGSRLATDVYPFNPDRIVIRGSLNDAGSAAGTIQAAAAAVYAAIATNLPGTPVTVIGVQQPSSSPSAGLTAANGAVLAAAAAAPNVDTIIDTTGWIQGTGHVGGTNGSGPADYLIASDDTHLSQLGHEYDAHRVADALQAVV